MNTPAAVNGTRTGTGKPGLDPALWLRRFRPAQGAPRRLVCFPHAGGSASFYHPVAATHTPGTDVVVLQYPARQDRRREPAITDIDAYAEAVADVLTTQPPKPTIYFGHSMGAVIAYETALLLAGTAHAPASLVVSGRRAPATTRDERVHERDDAGLLAELKRLNGTDSSLLDNDEILKMTLPSLRSDYRAIETYPTRPGRPLACPILSLVGDTDPKATPEEAGRWREHTSADFRLRTFPGGHFFLTTAAAEVNAELARELDGLKS
ncbi:alpha/beta fold hydrolase [Amycolatopsis rhabdoformis]|uniref:Alpha/beta fold hydrolase n=1 Tax=Amycolatopsis rhabdoformis TaxID=1448059 RepID=A0ABZ1IFG6_9PSEU|nr:alpha/beta fold hydrolase [Amycolatopsis rhabdoformis]WSE32908.1 alpha/beta fold hydrolase [Amycolatopsis rhabdoformis]